jgi:glycosyltransferase involved in cell wall biosynthesis
MRIGIVIGRIGGIDGVALEAEKWIQVLGELGHEVCVLTGELESTVDGATVLPELAFSHHDTDREQYDAFFVQDAVESELMEWLQEGADYIEGEVLRWIDGAGIELLITQNSTVLPCHLRMGMALKRVIERTGIPTIAHDHDFHWERGDRYHTRYAGVQAIIDECFPPDLPNLTHVVINSYCQESLLRERGMQATVIPNVMDFDTPFGQRDVFNRNLRSDLGYGPHDILLFQVTRIVRRKGIETAIQLIDRLDDPRIKLIITGTASDDYLEEYLRELEARVSRLPHPEQVQFAGNRFANIRVNPNGSSPVYSLSDAYAHAHAATYFSTYEGFGNAFVEAVAARVPIFVNNYKPVYWPDIGSKGFKTVQIEDNVLTDEAVEDIREILFDDELRAEIADHNFELGKKYFSYQVLGDVLEPLLNRTFSSAQRS